MALEIEPEGAEYYEILSGIEYQRSNWQASLMYAEQGLKFDPEFIGLVNARSQALMKLKRGSEAESGIRSALARDPENERLHENMGYTCLEKGEHKKALEHFSQAISANPQSEGARQGIIDSIKAQKMLYALLLKYFFFMSRLDKRTQIMFYFSMVFRPPCSMS